MKKKLLALFLALVMVGAVLPGCGDGSKDPGGQGNNGETGEPVKGGEITVGIAQDLDDSLPPPDGGRRNQRGLVQHLRGLGKAQF